MRFLLLCAAVALAAAVALTGSGCGQKGALYLRDNPPPGVKPAKPAPVKPVPYPEAEENK
jgi:predicted small lipoprotein YifL